MINLRYHIVSITAVFLALAIGVVMGTSFLGKATLDQLKKQIRNAEVRISNTEKENSRLASDLRRLNDRQKAMRQQGQQLLDGRLPGVPVLVIASEGVDRASLALLRAALEASGADFKGDLVVTGKMQLAGEDASKMAELLGMTRTRRSDVNRVLTDRMAQMLLRAAEPELGSGDGSPGSDAPTTTRRSGATTTTTTSTTAPVEHAQPALLTDLRAGGWLSYEPPTDGSGDDPLLTTRGYRYVVVSGADVTVPDSQLLRPLLTDIAAAGPAPVVVASAAVGADPESTRNAVTGPIRRDSTLKADVSTVDDLETFDGQAAVVLALEELSATHGHYGVGDGATSLLPPAP